MEQLTYRGIPIVYDETLPVDKPAIELQRAKLPKLRRKRPAIPDAVVTAMKTYARHYNTVYKRPTNFVYANGMIRINGNDGVSLKRLKELTNQLRERAKDL